MYNKIIEQFFNHRTLCLSMAQTSLYFDIHNIQLINCVTDTRTSEHRGCYHQQPIVRPYYYRIW